MIIGMTAKAKIAVSLPGELLDAVRAAVAAGHAPNVSAYVTDALEEKAKLDALDDLLDEMLDKTGGPLSDAERADIDRKAGWA
jgi:Arc/MetJ-type ribon-helix-helix transcriptional regulator